MQPRDKLYQWKLYPANCPLLLDFLPGRKVHGNFGGAAPGPECEEDPNDTRAFCGSHENELPRLISIVSTIDYAPKLLCSEIQNHIYAMVPWAAPS